MPRFMDFHQDLKLPAEAIAQIADDTRHARADRFGVRQVELYHNPDGQVYCLLEGPDEEAHPPPPCGTGSALRRRAPGGQPRLTWRAQTELAHGFTGR